MSLLSAEALQEINEVVVACGHAHLGVAAEAPLECRVDSAVTQIHVHWPTDVSLLWDAMRCLLRVLGRTCQEHEVRGWRKYKDWTNKVMDAFNAVRTSARQRNKNRVEAYLELCSKLVARAALSCEELRTLEVSIDKIDNYLDHALRQIDQVRRRLIEAEKIPHAEKVFSIHEPHTGWINKGKAGILAELGLPVCFLEDQYQFILHHQVLHEGADSDMIVAFMVNAKGRYPTIISCSLDKGYHSPRNRAELDKLLDLNVLPKKGRWSKADRARETAPAFAAARRKHPGIESAINNLNHRGLDKVRTHGKEGLVRTVALGVVAANVHRLGRSLRTGRSYTSGGIGPAVEKRRKATRVRTDTVEKRSPERQNPGKLRLPDWPKPENLCRDRLNINFLANAQPKYISAGLRSRKLVPQMYANC